MADDLLRQKFFRNDLENIHCRGIGGDDRIRGYAVCKLFIKIRFRIAVFYDRLLDEVRIFHGFFHRHSKVDTAEDRLNICSGDLAFFRKCFKLCFQCGDRFFTSGLASGPHHNVVAAHCVCLGNARPHGSGAEHCDFFNV